MRAHSPAMLAPALVPALGAVLVALPVPPAAAAPAPAPARAAPAATVTTTMPTLRYGATGPAVVTLQERLRTLHYDRGPIDGVFGYSTLHGVVAFQKVQGIARDGVVGPITWGKLASPYRPAERYWTRYRALEINLTKQVVYLARQGSVLRILDSSTGNGQRYWANGAWHVAVTPTGRYHVYSRYDGWWNSTLGLGWMYRPNYFNGGIAVHGSNSVPPYPASHGCVRITVPAMDRLWDVLWLGMRVSVYR